MTVKEFQEEAQLLLTDRATRISKIAEIWCIT